MGSREINVQNLWRNDTITDYYLINISYKSTHLSLKQWRI